MYGYNIDPGAPGPEFNFPQEAMEAAQKAQKLFTELGDEGGMSMAAQVLDFSW